MSAFVWACSHADADDAGLGLWTVRGVFEDAGGLMVMMLGA